MDSLDVAHTNAAGVLTPRTRTGHVSVDGTRVSIVDTDGRPAGNREEVLALTRDLIIHLDC
jgi:hypothetical protein